MSIQVKDFLGQENTRNKVHAALYTDLLRRAWGRDTEVLIGHHICFEFDKDIATEGEIPAADTLIFDHQLMAKVFGEKVYRHILRHLASVDCDQRDLMLAEYLELLDKGALELVDQAA